ncbi:SET domain-containing protein-lysine N-methyltransferase [soil metagenome]
MRFHRQSTPDRGNGVFAAVPLATGERLFAIEGTVLTTAELTDDMRALQIGVDLWLASDGSSLDDDVNHSCEPNAGFSDGTPTLFALRDIAVGEEITWDYSTSLSEPGWELICRCGTPSCRGVVKAWGAVDAVMQDRLRSTTLQYLR